MCRSEKAQWCLLISEQAVNGNLVTQLLCVIAVIRMKWWRGLPRGGPVWKLTAVTHRVTYTGVGLKTNYHLKETQLTQLDHCDLVQWFRSVFKKAELITSRVKVADQNRSLYRLKPLQSVHVCQLVQTQLSISHCRGRVREGNIKLPNMTELALSDERKPLIFPPFHHQSGGEEVAAGAQTADDVICNRGPPVSRENCSDSQHVAEWLRPSSAFSRKINSGGSSDNLHQPREYFLCQPH